MNSCQFLGRLTKDVELNVYDNLTVATTSLAVKRAFVRENGPDADFVRIKLFNKQAEIFHEYVSKGDRIAVSARFETDSYENQNGETVYTNEFVVERFTFVETKAEKEEKEGSTPAANRSKGAGKRSSRGRKTKEKTEEFEEFEDDFEDAI